jgi:hypothetical protein
MAGGQKRALRTVDYLIEQELSEQELGEQEPTPTPTE